jgi:polyphosphate kinase
MSRNLYERVETMFPVKDTMLRDRIRHEILGAYLADTVKARVLRTDGSYVPAWRESGKRKPPVPGFSAQDFMVALAEGKQTAAAIPVLPDRQVRRLAERKMSKTI